MVGSKPEDNTVHEVDKELGEAISDAVHDSVAKGEPDGGVGVTRERELIILAGGGASESIMVYTAGKMLYVLQLRRGAVHCCMCLTCMVL